MEHDRTQAPAVTEDRSHELRASWRDNAEAWTAAVRGGAIESRRIATDAAILEAILARRPGRTLDLGCGEGWLVRALAGQCLAAVGIDGSAPLIEAAERAGGGTFLALDYADIVADPGRCGRGFDLAVANFALLDEAVAPLLRAVASLLTPDGAVLVQTVHPLNVAAPYADGWRVEDFRGFGDARWTPMPWYFRTLASWVATLREGGLGLAGLTEPRHPEDGRPLSLLIEARPVPEGRSR